MHRSLLAAAMLLCAATAAQALDEDEQRERIDFETAKFESHIENNELLFRDLALDNYLQEVMDRLFPERRGFFQVRTFRDPNFNAFALASAGIYFNTGTLLRFTDEAQLAAVLGHEGTHVIADHMYRARTGAKKTAGVATFLGLIAAGAGIPPVLVDIAGYSSMAGFSRDYERESDEGGYQRLARAGYDPQAAAEAFAVLERELAAREIPQGGYFFASHPRVKERVETMAELARGAEAGGERGRDRYLAATLAARLDALSQLHRAGDHRALVFLLEQEKLLETLPPEARHYLAEAYRMKAQGLRRERKDRRSEAEIEAERAAFAARAAEEYRRTVAEAPGYGPPYEPLAQYLMKQGRKAEALAMYRRFIELTPDPRQSGYARQNVEKLTEELAQ